MINKLMVNKDKKTNSYKLLKNNRFKALIGAAVLISTLTACSPSNTNSNNNISNNNTSHSSTIETNYKEEDFSRYIKFNFDNFDKEIQEKEVIECIDENGKIYNLLEIPNDGYIPTSYDEKNTTLHSIVLNKTVKIPVTQKDERVIVNFDYEKNSIDVKVETYEYAKTK